MRIAFYAPFKPLDHPTPSGDLMIGRGIFSFLEQQGHHLFIASPLRSRWIYWKPICLVQAILEQRRIAGLLATQTVDLWLTYHSYYKAPDILGPTLCRRLQIPYAIIQPSYGTRVSRNWKTRPGFQLNRKALLAADTLITDRKRDYINLQRIIKPDRLQRIKPGLDPQLFTFDRAAREILRAAWQVKNRPVILSAAMFRSDVKTRSLIRLIKSGIRLSNKGHDFLLVIAGDGPERKRLMQLARELPEGKVIFAGRIKREEMHTYYSAADIFAFPGINESLGMVFLEAQSCGLPIVACSNGGIPEVVVDKTTGLLTALDEETAFDRALIQLLADPEQRKKMGTAAAEYVRKEHDINKNYLLLEQILLKTAHLKR
jgi:glycosyltransferase involved in cell wall biosynthesis